MGSQFQKCGNTDRKISFELCDVQGERGDVVLRGRLWGLNCFLDAKMSGE